jgi:hypothetical protein
MKYELLPHKYYLMNAPFTIKSLEIMNILNIDHDKFRFITAINQSGINRTTELINNCIQ